MIPVRRPNSVHPAQPPSGMVRRPNSSESACVALSLSPNN